MLLRRFYITENVNGRAAFLCPSSSVASCRATCSRNVCARVFAAPQPRDKSKRGGEPSSRYEASRGQVPAEFLSFYGVDSPEDDNRPRIARTVAVAVNLCCASVGVDGPLASERHLK